MYYTMKKIILIPLMTVLSLVVILFLLSLIPDDSENGTTPNTDNPPQTSDNPTPKGERLLGIDVTMSSNNDYMDAFSKAKELGAEFVTLSLAWDDIEKSPGVYDNENLAIANSFYPSQDTKLILVLSPIDTNNIRLPDDLKDSDFDDPEVIERFKKLIDYVISQTRDIKYVSIAIGNEIDVYLSNDKTKWMAYEEFFRQTSSYLKSKKQTKIGTKITFNGIDSSEAKSINEHSDVVMVTYYPLNSDFTVKGVSVVVPDFNKVTSIYPDKEIQFLEVGYPSGKHTKSTELKQAEFFVEVFKAWDKNDDSIKAVNLNWLHERSPDELNYFEQYYRISDKKFLDYLGTLGFRKYDGQPKQSFVIIQKESKARGW